jgi:protein arginine N-methyltransferase 1
MIEDVSRRAYAAALRATITRGSIVADIGTGTGFMALLACRFGAHRVYAIETSDSISVARDTARANGYSDRIVFLQKRSSIVTLPERVDVLVADLRGVLPPFGRHLVDIADVRDRMLSPSGTLIPKSDILRVSIVCAPEIRAQHIGLWKEDVEGFDLSPGRRFALNSWKKVYAGSEQLLTEPVTWATIHYGTVRSPRVEGTASCTVSRAGQGDGLIVWFDAELVPGIGFSNAPGAGDTIYAQGFFPWPEPVMLSPGDVVKVSMRADLAGTDYVWSWKTTFLREGGKVAEKNFEQSTFFNFLMTTETLAKRASDHRPALDDEGAMTRLVLDQMDGVKALEDIASALRGAFPERFSAAQDAMDFVADLSSRYSR